MSATAATTAATANTTMDFVSQMGAPNPDPRLARDELIRQLLPTQERIEATQNEIWKKACEIFQGHYGDSWGDKPGRDDYLKFYWDTINRAHFEEMNSFFRCVRPTVVPMGEGGLSAIVGPFLPVDAFEACVAELQSIRGCRFAIFGSAILGSVKGADLDIIVQIPSEMKPIMGFSVEEWRSSPAQYAIDIVRSKFESWGYRWEGETETANTAVKYDFAEEIHSVYVLKNREGKEINLVFTFAAPEAIIMRTDLKNSMNYITFVEASSEGGDDVCYEPVCLVGYPELLRSKVLEKNPMCGRLDAYYRTRDIGQIAKIIKMAQKRIERVEKYTARGYTPDRRLREETDLLRRVVTSLKKELQKEVAKLLA